MHPDRADLVGDPAYPNDVVRSIPIEALKPLAALDKAFFFGFHVEPMEAPALPHFASMKACLSNFSDTAYAVSGMDLVITIDSAMAHLAGADGRAHPPPAALLSRLALDDGTGRQPRYPSMRLYRQTVPGDWDEVIQRVVTDLSDSPT